MLRISTLCGGVLGVALMMLGPSVALAVEVELVGVFGSKAVLVVDGGAPTTLSIGARTREGVKLIEVSGDAALVEAGSTTWRITLGQSAMRMDTAATSSSAVSLLANSAGHHFVDGRINSAPVRFLVDTGASLVSIGLADARRAGIDYRSGVPLVSQTASGPAKVWRVRLDTLRIGDITVHGVDGVVHENDLPFVLLGMSFLGRMDMQYEGSRLVLRKRY